MRTRAATPAVMVDDNGRERSAKTVGTTTQDHLQMLKWGASFDGEGIWAIEDCRHLTGRLERDLIAAGESVVRVPTKLMAHARDSARTCGKSDPIDALARWPRPRGVSRICPWPNLTELSVSCDCWSTTAAPMMQMPTSTNPDVGLMFDRMIETNTEMSDSRV